MKRLPLILAAAVVVFAVFSAPDAQAQQRRNGRLFIGDSTTPVSTGMSVELGGPIYPKDTTLGAVIDGGLTVVGNLTLAGNSGVKAGVVDAGVLCVANGACATKLIPFTTASINFASGTIVCEDSSGTTVIGAKTTDSCFVGMPSSLTAGGTGLHHNYTCYVSAADTVKIRACAAGTADDPGAVTFTGFVMSAQ